MTEPRRKKLIEVGLPLEKINAESAREKSIRHGHPSTLHLWWARRPLATARAVLFAQLVDDPSAHPEEFPTVEEQDAERRRLHELIEAMVVWENTAPDAQGIPLPSQGRTVSGRELFAMAQAEIRKSNAGKLPAVLDPFAGGGSIPLEAQRLGLEAHASDLNPVAVLINKALIEIPPKFAGRPPVHPGAEGRVDGWRRAEGLAEDVRYYGQWMRDEAFRRIGHHYPTVTDGNGQECTVIAWIWARTVRSPNPANPIEVPLVRSWWLSKKKGKEAWIDARVGNGKVSYTVRRDATGPQGTANGTIIGGRGVSLADSTPIPNAYIRSEAVAGRLGTHLIALVAEGERGRVYLSPSTEQADAASVSRPPGLPEQQVPFPNHDVDRLPMYGMPTWGDAFTNRQAMTMVTLSDLVTEARERVFADALGVGLPRGVRLDEGGVDAAAYADAIATYLSFIIGRQADRLSSIASWQSLGEKIRNVFARQAIPMTWDFAEANPFSDSSGSCTSNIEWVAQVVERLPDTVAGEAHQVDAATRPYSHAVVSTDPPYYDNVDYSDLSDYFYVWLRRSLCGIYPSLFSTILVPKADELVANPYRHDGKVGAERFFVDAFNRVFVSIRHTASHACPLAVYYAYKQQDATGEGAASIGWHTLLDGLTASGWEVTATWPVRSERGGRMISVGANALASSIVLACRPRPADAPATTARQFLDLLRLELPGALRAMMQGAVAPVDLAQAAIGPGMSIYSRFSRVREADGSDMRVRDALLLINQILDEVIDEQESEFDSDTRFAVKWYRQYGWGTQSSGIADQLSRSTDTSLGALVRGGGHLRGKGRQVKIAAGRRARR
ncbi:MAG: DUF1156 domain-containing protein [Bifidobacteriaceae bacterium]|jgi:putative DNA methylase|nr:DUF1156 domain-containing protein [Bifidobacteriaceae bacterium]